MKKALVERNIAVILFILVLILFSFAERDSRKLERIYTAAPADTEHKLAAGSPLLP